MRGIMPDWAESSKHGGKGRSVVRPDRLRQPILAEGRFENRLHPRCVRLLNRLAAQRITTIRMRDGQRINPFPVPGSKPTLEVRAPDPVRTIGMRQASRRSQ